MITLFIVSIATLILGILNIWIDRDRYVVTIELLKTNYRSVNHNKYLFANLFWIILEIIIVISGLCLTIINGMKLFGIL